MWKSIYPIVKKSYFYQSYSLIFYENSSRVFSILGCSQAALIDVWSVLTPFSPSWMTALINRAYAEMLEIHEHPILGRKTEKPIERFLIIGMEIQTENRPIISDWEFLGLAWEIWNPDQGQSDNLNFSNFFSV